MQSRKEGTMRILLIAVLAGALLGCETGPSGRWVQAGRTDQEARDDYAHCQKVAMQEAQDKRSVEPFTEEAIKQQCMEREGYTYIKDQPKPSSSRY